jgi:hypothetical protein
LSTARIGPELDTAPASLCGWGHRVSVTLVIFPHAHSSPRSSGYRRESRGGVAALGPNPQCPSQLNTRPLSLLVGPRRQASPWTDSIAGARRGNRGQPLQVRGPSPTWSLRVRDSRPIKCLRQTPWLSPICTPPPDITARGSEIATTSIAH